MLKKNYFIIFFVLICVFKSKSQANVPEKKVDFLEKIYFSGKNKEELNGLILATLQTMSDSTLTAPTKSVQDQYNFLNSIQEQASQAEDACAIEGLLAAGIYHLDANEAMEQNVHVPTPKQKADAGKALASLNSANSSLINSSYKLNAAAYTQAITTGKTGATGKVAAKTAALSNNVNAATTLVNTGQQFASIGKSFLGSGKQKDKACNDVKSKNIVVGPHVLPQSLAQNTNNTTAPTSTLEKNITEFTINNADYGKVKDLAEALSVKGKITNRSIANSVGHFTLTHDDTADSIADFISDNLSDKCSILNAENGIISLAIK